MDFGPTSCRIVATRRAGHVLFSVKTPNNLNVAMLHLLHEIELFDI